MVRSKFSELFAQSADILAAIETVLARGEVKEIHPIELLQMRGRCDQSQSANVRLKLRSSRHRRRPHAGLQHHC